MKLFGTSKGGARLEKNRANVSSAVPTTSGRNYRTQNGVVANRQNRSQVLSQSEKKVRKKLKRRRNRPRRLTIFFSFLLLMIIFWFVVIESDRPVNTTVTDANGQTMVVQTGGNALQNLRDKYIETAMETLDHKWLATLVAPPDVIKEVTYARAVALWRSVGQTSQWKPPVEPIEEINEPDTEVIDVTVLEPEELEAAAKERFFKLFYEVDPVSLQAYLDAHPEALENGWDNLCINEAGLDDNGTDIQTIHGEQILAIDVPNQILLVRVSGSGFIGVLAVAKDPAMLYVRPSSQLWTIGETVGQIAQANNGVLAMTGSAFIDPDGGGNGGELAGYAMYDGVGDGYGHMGRGYKRLEIHENNLMYITDAPTEVGEGTTDAVEFGPALVLDGNIVVDANCGYTGIQPRACIGQSDKYEVLMLIIEGRMPTRSMGTNVIVCAEILERHGCMQAMNLDGGTSAIMWYDGESVTKCSNQALPDGRPLPTAFVYERRPQD